MGLLGLLLSTGGCSLRKVAYGLANRLVMTRLTDTFHLDDKQRLAMSHKVNEIHAWHRQQELPRYVALLDAFLPKLEDGLARGELEWLMRESTAGVERFAARTAPDIATILDTLSPQQIAQAAGEMKKSERERFEKLELPEEDYVRHRLKAARKNLNTWLGSYTPEQLAEYERFIRKNRPEELRRRRRTQQNQQALLDTLNARRGPQVLSHVLHHWMTRQEIEETPEYQTAETRSQGEFIDFLLTMDRSLSPLQRRHLLTELRAWRKDFDDLSHGR